MKEQIKAAKQSDQHYQERVASIRQEMAKREEEEKNHQEDEEKLEQQLQDITKKREEQREKLSALHKEMEACSRIIEEGKNEIIELLNRKASTKGKMQRYDAMLEQIGIRKASLSQRILKLKSDESEQQEIIKAHQEKYQEISGQMDQLNQSYQKTEQEMEIGQTAYHREESRLESLKNITERYEGYGNSIRRVMEQKERRPGIHGVVADLIRVEKQYEVAIETALGGSIQNIVTDNDQTAKHMIEFLKKNRYGRATFLPLTNMRRSSFTNGAALREPGVIGLADTLVEADETYHTLLSQILGRTLVVDTIDHAIAIGRKYNHSLRIVTLEGESLSPGGSMTGGAGRQKSKKRLSDRTDGAASEITACSEYGENEYFSGRDPDSGDPRRIWPAEIRRKRDRGSDSGNQSEQFSDPKRDGRFGSQGKRAGKHNRRTSEDSGAGGRKYPTAQRDPVGIRFYGTETELCPGKYSAYPAGRTKLEAGAGAFDAGNGRRQSGNDPERGRNPGN